MNKENTSIKILSLDGGGIKGSYVQLIILQRLKKFVKFQLKSYLILMSEIFIVA